MILEVDTHVEHQSSIVRGIKGIVADIGKTDVIGQVGIKHIIPDAASQSQSSVCASEIAVRERVLRLTVLKVFDLATNSHSKISAHHRLDREVRIHMILILQHQRYLQVVEIISHLLASGEIFLATLFSI